MVAIFTGAGLGLQRGSLSVLGGLGGVGLASLGRAGENVYVNGANGNLVISRTDEMLFGVGPDAQIDRVYNSQGPNTDDNGDNWRPGVVRTVTLGNGPVNTTGSTAVRTDWDGSSSTYTWTSTGNRYVSSDGAGAYDTLTFDGSNWTWTDGDSRVTEIYDGVNGRITSTADTDGNSVSYTYTGSLLTKVTTTDTAGTAEYTTLSYTGNLLTQIVTTRHSTTDGSGTATDYTRVRYGYDTANRLSSVTVDLTPQDNAVTDSATYYTNYTYQGTSTRVASIVQKDGSSLAIAYDGSNRVQTLTQTSATGVTRVTGFGYLAGVTNVTDSNGQVTTLTYDTNASTLGRLVSIQLPPAVTGDTRQLTQFSYNANGDVTSVTAPNGQITTYVYDANGNRTVERDPLGDTITRVYDLSITNPSLTNRLLTETRWLGPDPDAVNTGSPPTSPLTTRYAYDSEGHLRYKIGAEGDVVQYTYNAQGQIITQIAFTASIYTVSGLNDQTSISEAALTTWVGGISNKSNTIRSDTDYDFRGNVSRVTTYGSVNATTGAGDLTGDISQTLYIYDQAGKLLTRKNVSAFTAGTANASATNDETFVYDGLGRLISSVDLNNATTSTVFNDSASQTVLTLATGRTDTSVFNLAGELVSRTIGGVPSSPTPTAQIFKYDSLGRLRISTDATGRASHILYDNVGRKVAEIDPDASITVYKYDANNRLIVTIGYQNVLSSAQLASLVDGSGNPANPALSTLLPTTSAAGDRYSWRVYDNADRLVQAIDAAGAVTAYSYDGASRLTGTIQYLNALAASTVTAFKATPPTAAVTVTASSSGDRAVRNFYDLDSQLIATLDGEGYLTQFVYDKAGERLETIRFATAAASGYWASGTLAQLITSVGVSADDIHEYSIYDRRGLVNADIDGAGNLTRYHYNARGQLDYVAKGQVVTPSTSYTLATLPAAGSVTLDVTTYSYNPAGQILTETKALAGGAYDQTTYAYYSTGLLKSITTSPVVGYGAKQTFEYDARGRVIFTLTGRGNAAIASPPLNPATGVAMTSTEIRIGFGTSYAYDNEDRIVVKTEPSGNLTAGVRTLYFYNPQGQLNYEVDPAGQVTEYRYNAFGDRTDIIKHFDVIASGNLAGLQGGASSAVAAYVTTNAADSRFQAGFDNRGSISFTKDGELNQTDFSYNSFGQVSTKTEPLAGSATVATLYGYDRRGLRTGVTEDSASGGIQANTTTVYDAFGRETQITDPMLKVRRATYDRAGRVLTRTDALNNVVTYTYDGRDNIVTINDRVNQGTSAVTTLVYSQFNRSLTVTTPQSLQTVTLYDAFGHKTKITAPGGAVTDYAYDKDGNLTSITDPVGRVTANNWDNVGRLADVTNPDGSKTHYTFDAVNRVLTQTTDFGAGKLNLVTTYVYDAKGQQIRVTDPSGTATKIEYNLNGKTTKVTVDEGVGKLNLTTFYEYDKASRSVKMTEGFGTSAATATQYTYDALDRLTAKTVDVGAGRLNLYTAYQYDKNDNATQMTDAAGAIWRYTYDSENRLTYSRDPMGGVKQTTYNADGGIISVRAYYNALAAGQTVNDLVADAANDEISRNIFDSDGRLRFSIDPANKVTEYLYDAYGNLTRQVQYVTAYATAGNPALSAMTTWAADPAVAGAAGNRVTRLAFDAAGQQIYAIDPMGYVTQSTYDAMGRVIKKTRFNVAYFSGATPILADMNTWAAQSAIANDTENRISRNFYDGAGRLVFNFDAESYLTETQYDAVGRVLKSVRYDVRYVVTDSSTTGGVYTYLSANPSSRTLTRQYDSAGRLVATIDGAGARTEMTLNVLGQATQVRQAAGTVDEAITNREYDGAGRMTKETRGVGMIVPAQTLYSYDGVSRLTFTSDPDGVVTQYVYDGAGRMTESRLQMSGGATGIATFLVTMKWFDAFGNAFKVALGTRTRDASNAVQAFGEHSASYFDHDQLDRVISQYDPMLSYIETTYQALGNEVASVRRGTATTTFTRDKLDRLTATTDAEGYTESYVLNAFGDRKTVTNKLGGVTSYTYDKRGLKLSEVLPVNSVAQDATTVRATSITNRFEYDARGNLTATVEASGLLQSGIFDKEERRTVYIYDKMDRLTQKTGEDAIQTRSGLTMGSTGSFQPTEFTFYDLRGNVTLTQDAGGARTLYYYDDLNRKIAQVDPVGALKTWLYDANGNVVTQISYATPLNNAGLSIGGTAPSPANATGREVRYTYDRNNRLTGTEVINVRVGSWNGSSYSTAIQSVTTSLEYDAAGNVTREVDGRGVATVYTYDKLGRRLTQTDQNNFVTSWTYDGEGNVLLETRSDPGSADRVTAFTYDKNGRRLTEKRMSVAVADVAADWSVAYVTADVTVTYTYNGLGLVTSKTEGNGDFTEYSYDLGGRLSVERGPYYQDYQNTTVRHQKDYYYNGLNLVTRVTEHDATAALNDPTIRYTGYYYGAGGRLDRTQDSLNFYKYYSYDAAGRVVAEEFTRTMADVAYWQGANAYARDANVYTYDAAGRMTGQATIRLINQWKTQWSASPTSTGNNSVAWSNTYYNAYGDVIGRGTNGVQAETIEYDGAGRVWRSDAGDGVTRVFVRDANGNATMTIQSRGLQVEDAAQTEVDLKAYSLDDILAMFTNGGVVGTAYVPKLNATYTVFDGRNQAVSTVETFRELDELQQREQQGAVRQTLTTSKGYNAFGEVAWEADALNRVTGYAYNAMGRLTVTTKSGGPGVGYKSYYDRSGRLVATMDPKGYMTVRMLLAGSGYDGEEALALKERHADGGVVTMAYDVYGNLRRRTDEIGRVQTMAYDREGRLTSETNWAGTSQAVTDYYTVDELGRRIAHWNDVTGSGVQEWTDYDEFGRVARAKDFAGRYTSYYYAFGAVLDASRPFNSRGYFTKSTTNTSGITYSEHFDTFGHLLGTVAANGDHHNFIINNAGQTIGDNFVNAAETVFYGKRSFTFFNTGRLSAVRDIRANGSDAFQTTYSRYDAVGNKTTEAEFLTLTNAAGVAILDGQGARQNTAMQTTTATYDSLNRVLTLTDTASSQGGTSQVVYTYDDNGNVLTSNATFNDPVAGTSSSQAITYSYDVLNRLTYKSVAQGGVTTITTMLYNAAGQRVQAATGGQTETYVYDGAGYLIRTDITASGVMTNSAEITRDKFGRMTDYSEYVWSGASKTRVYNRFNMLYDTAGRLVQEMTWLLRDDGSVVQTFNDTFYALSTIDSNHQIVIGSVDLGGVVGATHIDTHTYTASQWAGRSQDQHLWEGSGSFSFRNEVTANTYDWDGGALRQTGAVTHLTESNVVAWSVYTSTFYYEPNNVLSQVRIQDGHPRWVNVYNDFRGQVMKRLEFLDGATTKKTDRTLYFDGLRWGSLGNDGLGDVAATFAATINARRAVTGGSAYSLFRGGAQSSGVDFDQSYEPINPATTAAAGGSYTVQIGDTLQSVARALWGDASLWYLIAEANNLSGSSALTAGQTLAIPNKVHNLHNTSDTFRPYDPNQALGDLDPAQAPQPKPPKNKGCGTIGTIILVAIAIAVTALTAGAAVAAFAPAGSVTGIGSAFTAIGAGTTGLTTLQLVGIGAAAGAAGSIASQAVGLATGLQDKFSWKGVALSAIAGGVGLGLTNVSALAGNSFAAGALRGGIGNVASQGVALATGLQDKFDWTGVAIGAVVGGVSSAVSGHLPAGAALSTRGVANALVSGLAGGVAGAAARSLVTGTDFGDNLRAVLPDVIGTTIGNAIAGGLSRNGNGGRQGPNAGPSAADGPANAPGGPSDGLMRGLRAAMPDIDIMSDLDLNLSSKSLFLFGSGGQSRGFASSSQTARGGGSAGGAGYVSILDADWSAGGSGYVTGAGETIQFGGRPSVTVNGVTALDEVTVTASPRGTLGWLKEAGSDLFHGRFSEIGGDLGAAGRSFSRSFMATDAPQHYGQAFNQSYTFQAGNGVGSQAGLRQAQSAQKYYNDTVVAPAMNRDFAIIAGGTIGLGVTGAVAAPYVGSFVLGNASTLSTATIIGGDLIAPGANLSALGAAGYAAKTSMATHAADSGLSAEVSALARIRDANTSTAGRALNARITARGGGSASAETTVLGHYPEYVQLSQQIGARRFEIPTAAWNKMSPSQQWAANQKYLDRMISRGDEVRLSTPLSDVRPGSYYERELQYMGQQGYRISPDGSTLIPPGGH